MYRFMSGSAETTAAIAKTKAKPPKRLLNFIFIPFPILFQPKIQLPLRLVPLRP